MPKAETMVIDCVVGEANTKILRCEDDHNAPHTSGKFDRFKKSIAKDGGAVKLPVK